MKSFFKSTLGVLSIWAISFIAAGILANYFLGGEYLFAIIFFGSIGFILVGVFIGWRNSIKEAIEAAEKKPE